MAWQRKIPFGYKMEKGELQCCPIESEAVKEIFKLYADGASYTKIADEMMAKGISYHHNIARWNKNMVKRILDNDRYLGEKEYPQIIENELYLSIQLIKGEKNSGSPCPHYIQPIREKAVCGVCGGKMIRDTKAKGKARWYCEKEGCQNRRYIEDEEVRTVLAERLLALSTTPHLLDYPTPTHSGELTLDAARIKQEVIRELNKSEPNSEYTKMLMMACSAERYSALPDPIPYYRMKRLQDKLYTMSVDENLCNEIFTTAVDNIIFTADGNISLRLINGKEYTPCLQAPQEK